MDTFQQPKTQRFNSVWRSHRVLYFLGIFAMGILYSGIPWIRISSISVPTQSESNVAVGIFTAKLTAGHGGLPLTITKEDGSTIVFSCAAPDLKLGNATCFRNQEMHNGALVKVYWSEQPTGYRPSRIEKVDGTVLFSEVEALQLLEAQTRTYLRAAVYLFLFSIIVYFPLMLVLDRLEVIERRQPKNPK